MIFWKDRHKNKVVVASKLIDGSFRIEIKHESGSIRWFATATVYMTDNKIILFSNCQLGASILDDAKTEALELTAGRLNTWVEHFEGMIKEITEKDKDEEKIKIATNENDEILQHLLLLVDENIPIETISAWTIEEKDEVEKWASTTTLKASDNIVRVPSYPDILMQLRSQ